MCESIRFGVSIDARLLARFNTIDRRKGILQPVRGIRNLIRDEVVGLFLPSLSCGNFFHV